MSTKPPTCVEPPFRRLNSSVACPDISAVLSLLQNHMFIHRHRSLVKIETGHLAVPPPTNHLLLYKLDSYEFRHIWRSQTTFQRALDNQSLSRYFFKVDYSVVRQKLPDCLLSAACNQEIINVRYEPISGHEHGNWSSKRYEEFHLHLASEGPSVHPWIVYALRVALIRGARRATERSHSPLTTHNSPLLQQAQAGSTRGYLSSWLNPSIVVREPPLLTPPLNTSPAIDNLVRFRISSDMATTECDAVTGEDCSYSVSGSTEVCNNSKPLSALPSPTPAPHDTEPTH
ncbi:hypothetical protein J6590_003456 [Homalodisca vitripennis]|nr:hypothetical protein J6590_003456 [Homalodisca vitripennis]